MSQVVQPQEHVATQAYKSQFVRRFTKNPAGVAAMMVLLVIVLIVILAPVLAPFNPNEQNLAAQFLPPGVQGHLLGTDSLGRDVFSRVLYGGRISLLIAVIATVVGMGIGLPIGIVSGFYGGKVDAIIMRVTDVLLAFPYLLLSIVIVGGLGPGLKNVTLSVAVSTIPFYVRLLRGLTVSSRNQQYVEAARAAGASDIHIMWHCIARNILPYIIVATTLNSGYILLAVAGLNFLGFGVQPPTPEWGAMLAENRSFITIAPYSVLAPGFAILVVVLALNIMGDALRDALDVVMPRG